MAPKTAKAPVAPVDPAEARLQRIEIRQRELAKLLGLNVAELERIVEEQVAAQG